MSLTPGRRSKTDRAPDWLGICRAVIDKVALLIAALSRKLAAVAVLPARLTCPVYRPRLGSVGGEADRRVGVSPGHAPAPTVAPSLLPTQRG